MLEKREILGHATGEFGNNLVYSYFNSFLLIFYTDVMELPAAFTGFLFLVSRIIVAASDPVVGVLSDRTRSRFGRYRIWLLAASPVVAVFLVLAFFSPPGGQAFRYIWTFVTFLVLGISFTATDVPFWTLPSVMTPSPLERARIFSLSGSVGIISGGLAGFLVPLVVSRTESLSRGYLAVSAAFAFILVFCYWLCAFTVRERVEKKKTTRRLSESLVAVVKNRPLLLASLGGFIVNIGFFLRNSAVSYYGIYVLGSYDCVSVLTLMILFGRLLGSFLVPRLSSVTGNRNGMITALLFGTLMSAVFGFTGFSNPYSVYVMTFLTSLSNGAFFVFFTSIISDTIDYGEYMFHSRDDGMITSFRTFTTKIGSAVAGSGLAFFLGAVGYRANEVQSEGTRRMLHMLVSAIPAFLYFAGLLIFLLYPLGKKRTEEIGRELEKMRRE